MEPSAVREGRLMMVVGILVVLFMVMTVLFMACGISAADLQQESAGTVATSLQLVSTVFESGGTLPVEYTCDGDGVSPPLAWSGVPEGTVEFALVMTTLAPDGLKWNWVLYHIPVQVTSIEEGALEVGTFGRSSDGPVLAYYGPCSTGPGEKSYTFTLYALSATVVLDLSGEEVTGEVLTEAIAPLVLEQAELGVTYTRVSLSQNDRG